MKNTQLFLMLLLTTFCSFSQSKITWISSTEAKQWQSHKNIKAGLTSGKTDAEVLLDKTLQQIDGFGTCFNELGWTSLSILNANDREKILKELFSPNVGANFTICRMPVGANDFSNNWYSYNETAGDFEMKNFSIANDSQTLIPFIKSALKYNPNIKLWASPWSPPIWMKYNKHYASKPFPKDMPQDAAEEAREKWGMDFKGFDNGLQPEQEGFEGKDMFIQEDTYFKAYSLYFSKFIQEYRAQNINISMVMPQNEFNSAQVFPSCTWTSKGLSRFLNYLIPAMNEEKVDVFFGTMERQNYKLVDSILNDSTINKSIKGVGFQWAGKDAIPTIHKNYPNLKLYQSEQECGNGKNDWKYCGYTWGLMKQYLTNGANAYMYWNTSLKEGGISTWGWRQNSLVSVDTIHKTFKYNYEYYLMKHLSHFVKPGAKRLETSGDYNNLLAFVNPDKSVVIVVQNDSVKEKKFTIKVGDKILTPTLEADSYNSFLLQ
jgi:glucosylceramidase